MPSGTYAIMTTYTDPRNIHMMAFFHQALYSLFLVCILSSFASAEVSLYEGSLQVRKTSGKTCDGSELRNSKKILIALDRSEEGISGYFEADGMPAAKIGGVNAATLWVRYPYYEKDRAEGHALRLTEEDGALVGELQEKHTEDADDCIFDEALISVRRVAETEKTDEMVKALSSRYEAQVLGYRGNHHYWQKEYSQAAALYRQRLELTEKTDGPAARSTAIAMAALVGALAKLEEFEQAERILEQGRQTFRELEEGTLVLDVAAANLLLEKGRHFGRTGRYGEAADCIMKGIETRGRESTYVKEVIKELDNDPLYEGGMGSITVLLEVYKRLRDNHGLYDDFTLSDFEGEKDRTREQYLSDVCASMGLDTCDIEALNSVIDDRSHAVTGKAADRQSGVTKGEPPAGNGGYAKHINRMTLTRLYHAPPPSDEMVRSALAKTFESIVAAGKFRVAIALFEHALRLELDGITGDYTVLTSVAFSYYQINEYATSKSYYEKAYALPPPSARENEDQLKAHDYFNSCPANLTDSTYYSLLISYGKLDEISRKIARCYFSSRDVTRYEIAPAVVSELPELPMLVIANPLIKDPEFTQSMLKLMKPGDRRTAIKLMDQGKLVEKEREELLLKTVTNIEDELLLYNMHHKVTALIRKAAMDEAVGYIDTIPASLLLKRDTELRFEAVAILNAKAVIMLSRKEYHAAIDLLGKALDIVNSSDSGRYYVNIKTAILLNLTLSHLYDGDSGKALEIALKNRLELVDAERITQKTTTSGGVVLSTQYTAHFVTDGKTGWMTIAQKMSADGESETYTFEPLIASLLQKAVPDARHPELDRVVDCLKAGKSGINYCISQALNRYVRPRLTSATMCRERSFRLNDLLYASVDQNVVQVCSAKDDGMLFSIVNGGVVKHVELDGTGVKVISPDFSCRYDLNGGSSLDCEPNGRLGIGYRPDGVVVSIDDKGAAKTSGLLKDDRIVAVDGRAWSPAHFAADLLHKKPGDLIKIDVSRNGKIIPVVAQLGAWDESSRPKIPAALKQRSNSALSGDRLITWIENSLQVYRLYPEIKLLAGTVLDENILSASDSGKSIVVVTRGGVALLDSATLERKKYLQCRTDITETRQNGNSLLLFSDDEQSVAVISTSDLATRRTRYADLNIRRSSEVVHVDERHLFIYSEPESTLHVLDLTTLAESAKALMPSPVIFGGTDGTLLLSTYYDDSLQLYDYLNGRTLWRSTVHDARRAIMVGDMVMVTTQTGYAHFLYRWNGEPLSTSLLQETIIEAAVDGNRLLSLTDQGRIIAWRNSAAGAAKELFTAGVPVVLSQSYRADVRNDGTWVVVDPHGRFDTNNLEQLKGLQWIMPDDPLTPLPLEIFMREYYEPGLLPRIINGETFPAVSDLSGLNRVQPGVTILSAESGSRPGTATVKVEVANAEGTFLRDGKSEKVTTGVHDLRLFRDGQLVGYFPREDGVISVDPATGKAVITFADIQLPRGKGVNNIEFTAYAFNDSRIKSRTDRKTYGFPSGLPSAHRKAYIISIGVKKYEEPSFDLSFAGKDAITLLDATAVGLTRTGGFDEVVPVPLVSDENRNLATKRNLRAILDLLSGRAVPPEVVASIPGAERIGKATPDDAVIVTFSGHGYLGEKGIFYFLLHDTGRSGVGGVTSELLGHAVSSDELSQWLRDVDAGEMDMVVDACHSAATVQGEGFKPGPMGSRGLGQLAYDKGMRILAGSQASEAAWEHEKLEHGILTYALAVEGLEKYLADYKPRDRRITMLEWLAYGADRVPQLDEELRLAARNGAPREVVGDDELPRRRSVQQPALFDFARGRDMVLN